MYPGNVDDSLYSDVELGENLKDIHLRLRRKIEKEARVRRELLRKARGGAWGVYTTEMEADWFAAHLLAKSGESPFLLYEAFVESLLEIGYHQDSSVESKFLTPKSYKGCLKLA